MFYASLAYDNIIIIYYNIQRKIFFRATIFLYTSSPCHYMRAWIRVLDAPGCYEHSAQAERKSALQGSGLVTTVGLCAQSRVPWAIATARDALLNDQRESTVCFERCAKQTLALATEPQAKREVRSFCINVAMHMYEQGPPLCGWG